MPDRIPCFLTLAPFEPGLAAGEECREETVEFAADVFDDLASIRGLGEDVEAAVDYPGEKAGRVAETDYGEGCGKPEDNVVDADVGGAADEYPFTLGCELADDFEEGLGFSGTRRAMD